MVEKLPLPETHYDGTHSYIKFSDLLRYVLALGIDCQPITPFEDTDNGVQSIDQCSVSQRFMYNEITKSNGELNALHIIVTDWHDDFEPNSQAKQNRGSV